MWAGASPGYPSSTAGSPACVLQIVHAFCECQEKGLRAKALERCVGHCLPTVLRSCTCFGRKHKLQPHLRVRRACFSRPEPTNCCSQSGFAFAAAACTTSWLESLQMLQLHSPRHAVAERGCPLCSFPVLKKPDKKSKKLKGKASAQTRKARNKEKKHKKEARARPLSGGGIKKIKQDARKAKLAKLAAAQ